MVHGCLYPSSNTLEFDCGMGMGVFHFRVAWLDGRGSWEAPIRRARVPSLVRKFTATGRMASKCSTALNVTSLVRGKSVWAERASARSLITLMLVNVSARDTSLRNADFL